MMKLAQYRWFGNVVRMGMRDTPKWPAREETQRKITTDLQRRDMEDFGGKRN
jgi:hypothetical protein